VGPHPYPMIVRDFQSVIGDEIRADFLRRTGRLPNTLVACVGGGSNAIGTFYPFLDDDVELVGVEAGGGGVETGLHAASISAGKEGVFHGMLTYVLQDQFGQILTTHSISAGLDYSGVGPEHAFLKYNRRARYVTATDKEAVDAFVELSKCEGIVPALEPAHALAHAMNLAREGDRDDTVVVTLSGRGDKDVEVVAEYLGVEI